MLDGRSIGVRLKLNIVNCVDQWAKSCHVYFLT